MNYLKLIIAILAFISFSIYILSNKKKIKYTAFIFEMLFIAINCFID